MMHGPIYIRFTLKLLGTGNKLRRYIHSIAVCRMRRFLAVLRSFFHSCLLCTFSCNPSPPTILPSSLTSSCHLFLGLPLNLVVPKFIYNTLLGILFPSILRTCPWVSNIFWSNLSITTKILYCFWNFMSFTTCFSQPGHLKVTRSMYTTLWGKFLPIILVYIVYSLKMAKLAGTRRNGY